MPRKKEAARQGAITREYERKGYGKKRAQYIARATVYHKLKGAFRRKKR